MIKLPPKEFSTLVAERPKITFLLLDVRSPAEYNEMRIEDAVNIPISELEARAHELKSFDRIVTYCAHGSRARSACKYLISLGFENVSYFNGNIEEWGDYGLPIVKGPAW